MGYVRCTRNLLCIDLTSILIFLLLLIRTPGQNVPQSPCPELFQYRFDGTEWFGLLSVKGVQLGQAIRINMNLSLRGKLPTTYPGALEIYPSREHALQAIIASKPVLYRVRLPVQQPLPRVTQILYNNRVICTGPADYGPILTSIKLEHTLHTQLAAQQLASQSAAPVYQIYVPDSGVSGTFDVQTVPNVNQRDENSYNRYEVTNNQRLPTSDTNRQPTPQVSSVPIYSEPARRPFRPLPAPVDAIPSPSREEVYQNNYDQITRRPAQTSVDSFNTPQRGEVYERPIQQPTRQTTTTKPPPRRNPPRTSSSSMSSSNTNRRPSSSNQQSQLTGSKTQQSSSNQQYSSSQQRQPSTTRRPSSSSQQRPSSSSSQSQSSSQQQHSPPNRRESNPQSASQLQSTSNNRQSSGDSEPSKLAAINKICGMTDSKFNVRPLVVGGDDVKRGTWPWLAAIYINSPTSLSFQCGGNLITNRLVLTSGHCFYLNHKKYTASDVIVFLGRHNILSWEEKGFVSSSVDGVYIHPDYKHDALSFDADIAIVLMKNEVRFTEYIRPVCLWPRRSTTDDIVGERGVVVGWGRNEAGQSVSSVPKRIETTIVSDLDCIRSNEQFRLLTSNRTFCAGDKNGNGPCTGDSGGGLMIYRSKKFWLRGTVSASLLDASRHSCNLNEYVVYVDISRFLDWIKSFMLL